MPVRFKPLAFCLLLVVLIGVNARSQHVADPHFNARVDTPAFTKNFPRVLFDEAHFNTETTSGRYKPFADLLFSDGYHLAVNRKPFTKESLQTFKILIIVNPLGAEDAEEDGAAGPAFTAEECEQVFNWIRGGGALLLAVDPTPHGRAAEMLATKLSVEMGKSSTSDTANSDKEAGDPTRMVYSRNNHLLGDHSITNGRSESERISHVVVFDGQSLKGPTGSDAILKMADTAVENVASPAKGGPAAGRAQAVAFRLGKGRVIVLGDAAMLSAQITGTDNRPFGINLPDIDNRQLVLNIMHWLSGLLK